MSSLLSAPPASMQGAAVSSYRLPDTDIPSDFQLMLSMAKELASADSFLPSELEGKPGNVLALMLRARALNIPFAVACDELYIQRRSNKIAQSARLVRALARRAGHKFFTLESTKDTCVLLILLSGEKEPRRVEFTIRDAHSMGLTDPNGNNKGGQWDKQPANMLYARCTTRAVTRYCPEVILGMGSDFLNEEMPDGQDGDQIEADDVIAAVREEDRKLVEQVLLAAKDTDYLDDGEERETILLKLGSQYGQVLNYDAGDGTGLTVRQALLGRLREAVDRKRAQQAGEEVPPPPPFPEPTPGGVVDAEVVEETPAKGDGPARARKAAGGHTGARARAREEKAQRTQTTGADRQQVFDRMLETGGTWDRKLYGILHAEMTGQTITGDRAAAILKSFHEAHPDRVTHKKGTRYTVVVDKAPAAPKAPAKTAASRVRRKPQATPITAPVQLAQGKPAPDGRTLACGCNADEVLFNDNTHNPRTCKNAPQR